ncbi:uncharacterized protein N7525_004205 [Penicillium rubens]|jgi:hypothetical protein|uniref:uncharacterized protein n=1 Tax=Penicillium rubens TaxID=1108849 RepID=UPI002A5A7373|nr:uncharacterized protein N7525_004205 [Penicillium rubens]KAJ5839017.1 hypothetical protein N7525_004205 [Penicillium rubens]KAJ5867070.1 hypothetical protein N7534_001623 [Penicillium rubens]
MMRMNVEKGVVGCEEKEEVGETEDRGVYEGATPATTRATATATATTTKRPLGDSYLENISHYRRLPTPAFALFGIHCRLSALYRMTHYCE